MDTLHYTELTGIITGMPHTFYMIDEWQTIIFKAV